MTSLLQKINDLNVRVDNVSTSGGTTDTTALQAQVDTNTTDISGIQTNKQNVLIAGDNITNTGDTISASGGGSTIDSNTDLSVKTLTTSGDVEISGRLNAANEKMFINNQVVDLDGLTSYNLRMNEEWLTSNFVTHNNGLYTFQNLVGTDMYLFIVTVLVGVESDTYNDRVNWRLTPYLNNANFSGYGRFYTTTEGSISINRYSTLMVRTLVGARNGQIYRLNVDCNKEGDNTFGSSMNGLRIRNAPIVTFQYVGPFNGQQYTTS